MIEIQNICKSFNSTLNTISVLKDINLSLKKGEVLVIYGESGSGKSTLLSIIASAMKPSSGKILVDGQNIVSFSDIHASEYRKNRIGFITQSFHLFDELNLHDNLLPPLLIRNLTKNEIEKSIDNALKIANISHKKEFKTSTLSGGERQRAIIARAIVNDPDIIICDEPTANLDECNSLIFVQMLRSLQAKGKTLIIASHDPLFKTQDFVNRIITIKDGSLE